MYGIRAQLYIIVCENNNNNDMVPASTVTATITTSSELPATFEYRIGCECEKAGRNVSNRAYARNSDIVVSHLIITPSNSDGLKRALRACLSLSIYPPSRSVFVELHGRVCVCASACSVSMCARVYIKYTILFCMFLGTRYVLNDFG